MKNLLFIMLLIALPALSLGILSNGARAQDPVAVAPASFKVLLENERVRVVEVQFAPGVTNPTHSHPDYVIYPLTSNTVKSIAPDGSEKVFELKAGTPRWAQAVTHADENVGTSVAHALLIELK